MLARGVMVAAVAGLFVALMAEPVAAQVRYSGGVAYRAGGYYNGGVGYYNGGGYYNGNYSSPQQFGYGAQGAWNALSRRHGYDPVYVVQQQPVVVQQPIVIQQQPTLYLGGTGYQYAPTVYGQPNAIYRGY
jgi:hypothetical protein